METFLRIVLLSPNITKLAMHREEYVLFFLPLV